MTNKAETAALVLRSAPRLGFRHSRVQNLRALIAKRSQREKSGQYVIEGAVTLLEALNGRQRVVEVFVDADRLHEIPSALLAHLARTAATIALLDSGVIQRIGSTVTPQPIIAIVEKSLASLNSLKDGAVIVLVDVADPGNAGTIIRSAEASGMRAVVAAGTTVDLFSPKTVRSGASAHFNVDLVVSPDLNETVETLKNNGYKIIGTRAENGTAYFDAQLGKQVAVLVGNEAHGLPAKLPVDEWLTIPMAGKSESLNAAVATSIICFEASRQRLTSNVAKDS